MIREEEEEVMEELTGGERVESCHSRDIYFVKTQFSILSLEFADYCLQGR